MHGRRFFFTVGSFGFLSLSFQLSGLLMPGWFIADLKINTQDTRLVKHVCWGLFWGYQCVETENAQECEWFSIESIHNTVQHSKTPDLSKALIEDLIESFLPIKFMAVSACVGSIIVLFMMAVYATSSLKLDENHCGTIGSSMVIISGILLLAAVGYQTNQYSLYETSLELSNKTPEFRKEIELSVHFPWAIIMTGTGALFVILTGFLVSLRLCHANKKVRMGKLYRNLEECG